MRVTREDVDKIAALANLDISENEKEMFRVQMEKILGYAEKLNELDTEAVEPTYFILQPGEDRMREDRVAVSLTQEEALMNAPSHVHGFFRVPKVVSKD
jgi:aspartyl-tRNA(Asn)/glutamyl-tRNA(Gln) amidotransferase subunit C